MPPKSRKKRLNDEKATVAREGKKAKVDEPALEQAIAQIHSVSTETTPPAVDPEESDRSGATFNPEKEATSSTAHNLSSLFLQYNLKNLLSIPTTLAAEYTGIMLGEAHSILGDTRPFRSFPAKVPLRTKPNGSGLGPEQAVYESMLQTHITIATYQCSARSRLRQS